MHALSLLRELGLDPASDEARRVVDLVRERVTWRGWDWDGTWRGEEFTGTPFFVGEVEPCINGQTAASGAYFGQDVDTTSRSGRRASAGRSTSLSAGSCAGVPLAS